MELCQWTQESPVGPLTIAAGRAGVRSVALGGSASGHTCEDCRAVHDAMARYFAGDVAALAGVRVDLGLAGTDFQRLVLQTLREIVPPGSTTTYGALAAAVGRSGAARAVGTAMARNPVPILVPCHRVLRSEGGVGNYGGGPDMKRFLLELEGAPVARQVA